MLDNNKIVNALRLVKDPKSGLNIIEAKMVEDFRIDENNINFTIILKENDPKIKSELNFLCIGEIKKIYPDANVNIMLKDTSKGKDAAGPLPQIKNIIAVASGKGGVGKSTVSVNLATTLSKRGHKVGILDADVYGPSIPTMLGLNGQRPKVEILYGKHKILPLENHGIHVMSIGFIVEPEQAVVLRGPRLGGIIKQFINDCLWPDLDYLIVDLPPGTGDVQLTLVQSIAVTGAVMVTTPQKVAVIDAVKAMNMFLMPNVNVPILGVVENMSWFTPKELPDNKYYIFGEGGGKSLADKADAKLLGKVPIVQSVREGGDSGIPVSLTDNKQMTDIYDSIAAQFEEVVAVRNKTLPPTKKITMQQ